MPSINLPRFIAACLVTAGLFAHVSIASAASHCKGMAENACSTDSQCTWVAEYTRKDGRTVSSHCKLRRGKQSARSDTSRTMAATAAK